MNELKGMKNESLLRLATPQALCAFDWDAFCAELVTMAPSLLSILKSATTLKVSPSLLDE